MQKNKIKCQHTLGTSLTYPSKTKITKSYPLSKICLMLKMCSLSDWYQDILLHKHPTEWDSFPLVCVVSHVIHGPPLEINTVKLFFCPQKRRIVKWNASLTNQTSKVQAVSWLWSHVSWTLSPLTRALLLHPHTHITRSYYSATFNCFIFPVFTLFQQLLDLPVSAGDAARKRVLRSSRAVSTTWFPDLDQSETP